MKKKRIEKENGSLENSGAQSAFKDFQNSCASIDTHVEFVVGLLSKLNIDALHNLVDVRKSEKDFGRPWTKIDRPKAYEWMSQAYRAVDNLAYYTKHVSLLSKTLNEIHHDAQATVELTEKAFADAKVTIGMEVA